MFMKVEYTLKGVIIEMMNGGKVRYIEISGMMVGVIGMDEVIREVDKLKIDYESDPGKLAEELLTRFEERNHIPPAFRERYMRVLIEEYLISTGKMKRSRGSDYKIRNMIENELKARIQRH